MINVVIFLNADFGRVMVERGKVPHQNRLCFSLPLSFAEAKESGELNHSLLLFFESFFKKSIVEFLMVIAILILFQHPTGRRFTFFLDKKSNKKIKPILMRKLFSVF